MGELNSVDSRVERASNFEWLEYSRHFFSHLGIASTLPCTNVDEVRVVFRSD